MNHSKQKLAARLRLWLRGERALGLSAIPISAPAVQEQAGPEDAQLPAEEPHAIPLLSPESADLFGRSGESRAKQPLKLALAGSVSSPELSLEQKRQSLLDMDVNQVRSCTRCRLCEARSNTVFGEGDPGAQIFFIGEGPGETEDRTGRPFVGRAGELLDRMIVAMGLKRGQVFIANIVKCRPPGNREPGPDEVAACTPFLERQIEIVRPRVLVTLGRPAAQHMLGEKISITKIRGQWQSWRGIRLMPTFHPAYILRQYTPQTRAAVWSDLQEVMRELGLPLPKRREEKEV